MLNKHDYKYKSYLKLEKRLDELYKEIRKIPLTKLETPYQNGWIISFELRPDVKRRRDAKILQHVLDLIYHQGYTKIVSEVKAIRAGQVSIKKRRGQTKDLIPQRRSVSSHEYESMTPQEKKYFDFDMHSDMYKKYGHKVFYGIFPKHWLVLKARPNIVTHIRLQGGPLQKEYDHIRQKLSNYWKEQGGYSKSFPAYKDRAKTRAQIQKFKSGEIDDIVNHKIPMEYVW